MSTTRPLAVQSYCFRGIKGNAEVAAKVKEIGLSAIELCGVHANFADPSAFDSVLDVYAGAGVEIVSIGVQGFGNDPATEAKNFDFAKKAGCTTISVDFAPDCILDGFKAADKMAEKNGMNLAIHNHGGTHWLGNSAILDWVFKNTSKRIGLMLDTAWALQAHEDPIRMVERFKDRLYGVHVKDFLFDRAGNHEDVVVGTGNLDLSKLFKTMNDTGFAGNVILEYEGDVDNPVPALSKCVVAMKKEYA